MLLCARFSVRKGSFRGQWAPPGQVQPAKALCSAVHNGLAGAAEYIFPSCFLGPDYVSRDRTIFGSSSRALSWIFPGGL